MSEPLDNLISLPTRRPNNRGHFFAVDRRAFAQACTLGLNPAVAYLVLARFSGGDNRTTKAGTQSVEKYTGISRPRAKLANQALVAHGLVSSPDERAIKKLIPAHQAPGCEGFPPTLSVDERKLFDKMLASANARGDVLLPNGKAKGWGPYPPRSSAAHLVRKALVRELDNGWFRCTPYQADEAAKPDWIWLPNAIVSGAANETPPLELIRQAQDVMLLTLFVDLYHTQSLANDGGIHWRQVREEYTREKIGQQGTFTVWGFQPSALTAWPVPFVKRQLSANAEGGLDWQHFWDRIRSLLRLGLLEFVPHVIEADTATAEIIHPYAIDNGEPMERRLSETAHAAGKALLTEEQADWVEEQGFRLVPVQSHISNVRLIGVGRLHYRPRTSATAAWYGKMQETCSGFLDRYSAMGKGKFDPQMLQSL